MDIVEENGIYYIATSAIVEYPNAYRIFEIVKKGPDSIGVDLDWRQISDRSLIDLSRSRMGENEAVKRLGTDTDRVQTINLNKRLL